MHFVALGIATVGITFPITAEDQARGESYEAYDRSIDVQVSRLRRKLESDAGAEPLICTLRNVGYLFTASMVRR